jgi:hypothetical protein
MHYRRYGGKSHNSRGFRGHLALRDRGEVESDIRRNYADNVVLIVNGQVRRGHDAIARCARSLREDTDGADFIYRAKVVEGEIAYLEWAIDCDGVCIEDGVDTFLIRDGKIVANTVHYTLTSRRR